MQGTAPTGNTLGSLDRGLTVLELIGQRGEARLAELARELGTSRTTMFRVLETLRARGFAEHVAASHTYRRGPGAPSLAAPATQSATPCVAAAIAGADGRPAAAISVSGLSDRMHRLDLAELGQRVQARCATIATALRA